MTVSNSWSAWRKIERQTFLILVGATRGWKPLPHLPYIVVGAASSRDFSKARCGIVSIWILLETPSEPRLFYQPNQPNQLIN
jgi:hypothetical protein